MMAENSPRQDLRQGDQPPALAQILFGESASLAWSSAGEELRLWARALDEWLAEMQSRHGKRTARACRRVLGDFLQQLQKTPWEATSADAVKWMNQLASQGLSVNTLRLYTSYLDQFYRFALAKGLEMHPVASPALSPALGPVVGPSNPIDQAWKEAYRRQISRLYLDEAETGALLDAIRRNPTLVSLRDYAFILCCLVSGLTFSELQSLKWEELRLEPGGQLTYQPRQAPLPVDCGEAILDYLRRSGRLSGMQPGEFVFAPLARFGSIPCGCREEWNSSASVSQELWWQILRRAAAWAGLREELVNYRLLRNTAAYLRIRAGDNPAQLQAFLNLKRLRHARAFIREIQRTKKGPLWAEPNPDRPRERQPYSNSWKELVKAQPLLPAGFVQGVDVLEIEPPLVMLERGIAHARLIRDYLLEECLPQVEDSRTLFNITRSVNRVSGQIRTLLPQFKKALEKETLEAADRKKIQELVERMKEKG